MKQSETTAILDAALALAQADLSNVPKTSPNPFFKSRYADLAEVLDTVRPVFAKHGLSIVQSPAYENKVVSVTTRISCKGEWLEGTASCPVTKDDAQGVGSAITYLRRYALAAFAGVAQTDDDGNAATGKSDKPAAKEARPPTGTGDKMAQIVGAGSTTALRALTVAWKKDCTQDELVALVGPIQARMEELAKEEAKKK
jgi:hypothetical protein